MKFYIQLLALLCFSSSFAQGSLFIQNNTGEPLDTYLVMTTTNEVDCPGNIITRFDIPTGTTIIDQQLSYFDQTQMFGFNQNQLDRDQVLDVIDNESLGDFEFIMLRALPYDVHQTITSQVCDPQAAELYCSGNEEPDASWGDLAGGNVFVIYDDLAECD